MRDCIVCRGKVRKGVLCQRTSKQTKTTKHAYMHTMGRLFIYFLSSAPSIFLSFHFATLTLLLSSLLSTTVIRLLHRQSPCPLLHLTYVGHSNIFSIVQRSLSRLPHAQSTALLRACPSCFNKYRAPQAWRGIALMFDSPVSIMQLYLQNTS